MDRDLTKPDLMTQQRYVNIVFISTSQMRDFYTGE